MAKEDAGASREEADQLRRQRAILGKFGERALRSNDLDSLLQEATEAVSEAIGVRLVKVLQLLPEEGQMLVRAGVGWRSGVVGQATLGADEHSPSGYALLSSEPVISLDLTDEDRFEIPALLREHGVRSMINVAIAGRRQPWGVLEVDSPENRTFDQDDVIFMQNYANLVAAAIERLQVSSERDEALEQTRILLREVQHRVANMLAKVRAVARLTRKTSRNLDDFAKAFDGRLAALIRTQEILVRDPNLEITVRDLVRQELDAHGSEESGKLILTGPDVLLTADVARALAMAFHELATNAVKHGALFREDGKLEVSWSIASSEKGEELVVRWRECGVPIGGPPERRGLGVQMIEEGVPYMISGTSSLNFHPDGVEYTVRFRLPRTDPLPVGRWESGVSSAAYGRSGGTPTGAA